MPKDRLTLPLVIHDTYGWRTEQPPDEEQVGGWLD